MRDRKTTSPLIFMAESLKIIRLDYPVSEFNKFKSRLRSLKNWFQLSAALNLENWIQF